MKSIQILICVFVVSSLFVSINSSESNKRDKSKETQKTAWCFFCNYDDVVITVTDKNQEHSEYSAKFRNFFQDKAKKNPIGFTFKDLQYNGGGLFGYPDTVNFRSNALQLFKVEDEDGSQDEQLSLDWRQVKDCQLLEKSSGLFGTNWFKDYSFHFEVAPLERVFQNNYNLQADSYTVEMKIPSLKEENVADLRTKFLDNCKQRNEQINGLKKNILEVADQIQVAQQDAAKSNHYVLEHNENILAKHTEGLTQDAKKLETATQKEADAAKAKVEQAAQSKKIAEKSQDKAQKAQAKAEDDAKTHAAKTEELSNMQGKVQTQSNRNAMQQELLTNTQAKVEQLIKSKEEELKITEDQLKAVQDNLEKVQKHLKDKQKQSEQEEKDYKKSLEDLQQSQIKQSKFESDIKQAKHQIKLLLKEQETKEKQVEQTKQDLSKQEKLEQEAQAKFEKQLAALQLKRENQKKKHEEEKKILEKSHQEANENKQSIQSQLFHLEKTSLPNLVKEKKDLDQQIEQTLKLVQENKSIRDSTLKYLPYIEKRIQERKEQQEEQQKLLQALDDSIKNDLKVQSENVAEELKKLQEYGEQLSHANQQLTKDIEKTQQAKQSAEQTAKAKQSEAQLHSDIAKTAETEISKHQATVDDKAARIAALKLLQTKLTGISDLYTQLDTKINDLKAVVITTAPLAKKALQHVRNGGDYRSDINHIVSQTHINEITAAKHRFYRSIKSQQSKSTQEQQVRLNKKANKLK